MLKMFKELFANQDETSANIEDNKSNSLQIAAGALLLEIANADENYSSEEKLKIIEIMKVRFNLNDHDVSNLIEQSKEEIQNSVSVYEFTDILNKNLNQEEKFLIVKSLWEIAYADGELDKYEDYYIKRISNNLHLHHKDRIAAKIEVKNELNI